MLLKRTNPCLTSSNVEIRHIAMAEMVTTREDLLRRRLPAKMSRSDKELSANKPLEKLLVELGL